MSRPKVSEVMADDRWKYGLTNPNNKPKPNISSGNDEVSLIYTQRQKLSTTNFVAKFFRVWLCDVNKPYK